MNKFEIFKANRLVFENGAPKGEPSGKPSASFEKEKPKLELKAKPNESAQADKKELSAWASGQIDAPKDLVDARVRLAKSVIEIEKKYKLLMASGIENLGSYFGALEWVEGINILLLKHDKRIDGASEKDKGRYLSEAYNDVDLMLTRLERFINLFPNNAEEDYITARMFVEKLRASLLMYNPKTRENKDVRLAYKEAVFSAEFKFHKDKFPLDLGSVKHAFADIVKFQNKPKGESEFGRDFDEGEAPKESSIGVEVEFYSSVNDVVKNIETLYKLYEKLPKELKTEKRKAEVKALLFEEVKVLRYVLKGILADKNSKPADLPGYLEERIKFLGDNLEPKIYVL